MPISSILFWTRSPMQSAPLSAGWLSPDTSGFGSAIRNVAQSLERAAWDREAGGENPSIPTIFDSLLWLN